MKKIFRKLGSNQGSSMILALLFMLVAMMVSHTILAASASAARSTLTQTDRQQAFLTVNSAAQMLKESVGSMGAYEKDVRHTFTDNTFAEETGQPTVVKKPSLQGPFGYEIQTLVEDFSNSENTEHTKDYLILVDEYEPVAVTFTLKKVGGAMEEQGGAQCSLTAVFTNLLPNSLSGAVSGYTQPEAPTQITVTITGNFTRTTVSTDENSFTKTLEDKLVWSANTVEFQKQPPEDEQP